MSQPLNKITAERNQKALLELASKPGNDVCADCKARNPRWASYSLGIFICMNCASIHRKIGTHVTKVKSLSLDSWTKEQVEKMKQNGNVKSNQHYNPDETRHPPPTNMTESERDSELEIFIRAKYEYKKFISRSALAASYLGPSKSISEVRPRTTQAPTMPSAHTQAPPLSASSIRSSSAAPPASSTSRSQPRPPRSTSQALSQPQAPPSVPKSEVWDDLISLQTPSDSGASLPLQYHTSSFTQTVPDPSQPFNTAPAGNILTHPLQSNTNPFAHISANFTASVPMTSMNTLQPTGMGMLSMAPTGLNAQSVGLQPQQPGMMFMQAATNPTGTFPSSDPYAAFGSSSSTFAQHSPSFATPPLPFQTPAFAQAPQQFFPSHPQMQAAMPPFAGLSGQTVYFQSQSQGPSQLQSFMPQAPPAGMQPAFGQQQQQAVSQGAQYGNWQQGQQWGAI